MKQRELEMRLQGLEGFAEPRPDLEQYSTPARIAADMLYTAHAHGDIARVDVIDLGCGTGIFSVGACLLGAGSVTGLDVDAGALGIAGRNAAREGCEIDFRCGTVDSASGHYGTCIMNPPFGSQKRHADMPFLEKSMEIADTVYSMHNTGTMEHLRRVIERAGRMVDLEKGYEFEIRHTFDFHRKERARFDVTMLRIVMQ